MQKKESKRYTATKAVGDLAASYSVAEAVEMLAKMPKAKFDETVEISARLGVSLPNGSGKKVAVIVFTENPQEALDAGADAAGLADLIEKVNSGWTGFDVAISTTSAMKDVRKVARVLGPRGLMPNPKSGTVSDDIPATIKAVKGGRVEFKMDKTANIAIVIGKRSFDAKQLAENAEAAIQALVKAEPEALKGTKFIKSLTVSSTMSAGVKIDVKPYIA